FCPEYFDRHVDKLNAHLGDKCAAICDALDRNFGTTASYYRPKGGIFIWVTLDKSIDILRLTEEAAKEGVAINAGPEWSIGAEADYQMRLCFGYPDIAVIKEGVEKLAEICQRHFGLPKQISNQG
ncbi:MAG: PLP-dependent aminotransferase family protein, partial [Candidatus Puniceispirillaceae bacterium]